MYFPFYKHFYSIGHHFIGKCTPPVDAYGNSRQQQCRCTHIMVILEWKHINHICTYNFGRHSVLYSVSKECVCSARKLNAARQ